MSHSAWRIAAVMIVPALASTAVLDRLATDTPVRVRLMQRLSSAESHVNDRVEFEVSEDVKIGNFTVITAGSSAWGAVVEASPRSRLLRSGRLAVDIRGVCLANGQRAPLRGTPSTAAPAAAHPSEEGPSTNLLALPALPVMLFLYGKDITIPAGHFATAYVSPGVNFDPASLVEAPNTSCNPDPAPPGPTDALCAVIIRSTPTDAELTVDGHFIGNAPSTVHLAAGDHLISVSAPGRKTWERTVHLTRGDEVTVTATLEARPPIEAPGAPRK